MRETVLDLGSTSSNITTDKDLLKIIELCYNKKPLSKQPTTQEKIMVTALVLLNIERQHIKDISQKLVNMHGGNITGAQGNSYLLRHWS